MNPIGNNNPFSPIFFGSWTEGSSESENSNSDSDVDISSVGSYFSEEDHFVTAFNVSISDLVYEVSIEHLPNAQNAYPIRLDRESIESLSDAIFTVIKMKEEEENFHYYSPEERLILEEISVIELTCQPIKSLCRIWGNVIESAITRIEETFPDEDYGPERDYFEGLDSDVFSCIEKIIGDIDPHTDIYEFISEYA